MATSNDPLLYRIMDIFEIVNLASEGVLRVPCAASFRDVNELMGNFLSILDDPMFHPYTEEDMGTLISQHELSKEGYFISSWTKTKDNIAMWELYSPRVNGIQIGMKKSAIEAMFKAYSEKNSSRLGHNASANDGRILFYPHESAPCEYVCFDKLFEAIKDRYKKFNDEFTSIPSISKDFKSAYMKFADARSVDFNKSAFYKDHAYKHEEEYRFVLRGITRNNRPYDECQKDLLFELFDTHMRQAMKSEAGENVFIPFDLKCIEELMMDGRTPHWKQKAINVLLGQYGLTAEVSKAYGSFFKHHRIRPMR